MINKESIIISLWGSLVAPGEIDVGFLKRFRHSIKKYFNKNKFIVIIGGWKIAIIYQYVLSEFGAKSADRDLIGINVSRLNAEVVRQLFGGLAYSKIITDPNRKIKTEKNIIVGAGWKPGWSTDYCAVLTAKNYGAKTIINLTNVDYVYDRNPSQFPDAKSIKEIDWKDFRKIVGEKWTPGLNSPFDPRATKLAEKLKLKVTIINGKNLERLDNFLNNKPFIGTIIK